MVMAPASKRTLLISSALVMVGCTGPEVAGVSFDDAKVSRAGRACAMRSESSSDATGYLYCQVLGREPTPDEATKTTARLDDFASVRRLVIRDLALSEEFTTARRGAGRVPLTDEEKVGKAYAVLLGQAATGDDVRFWTSWVKQRSFEAFVLELTTRPAFFTAHPKELFLACSEARLRGLVNTGEDASLFLQEECIGWAQPGATGKREVRLPAGTYKLSRALRVAPLGDGLVLGTLGLPSGTRCDAPNVTCATLRASDDFLRTDAADVDHEYVVQVLKPNVTIDGVVIDANKDGRYATWLAKGRPPLQWSGTFHNVHAGLQLRHSVVKNTLQGSAVLLGGGEGMRVERNLIGANGRHAAGGWWADGATITDLSDAVFEDNDFVDNTAIQLIFGGCKGCRVAKNRFRHTGDPQGAAWAEIMFQAWPKSATSPGTSGDFAGTIAEGNTVDCSDKRLCSFGILVGNESWSGWPELAGGTAAQGVTIRDNDVRRAIVGINVDRATGPITLYGNRVRESGGRYLYKSNTNEGDSPLEMWLSSGAVNVSSSSVRHLRGQDGSSRLDFTYTITSYAELLTLMPTSPPPQDPAYSGPDDPLRGADVRSLSSSPEAAAVHFGSVSPPKTDEDRVTMLYLMFLRRAPDAAGLADWTSRLRAGSTLPTVARGFVDSQEFNARDPIQRMPLDRLVATLYETALLRAPEAEGYRHWLGQLESGALTRDGFVAAILGSPEFAARFAGP